MQYLAKVHLKSSLEGTQLQLLAANTYEDIWEVINPAQILFTAEAIAFNEQALVLLDLDSDKKVLAVKEATQWVIDFVATYLSLGLTPTALLEEAKRAEQWRQSLTLQNQEVRRRALETAARRDEIQDLEKRLKLEKQKE